MESSSIMPKVSTRRKRQKKIEKTVAIANHLQLDICDPGESSSEMPHVFGRDHRTAAFHQTYTKVDKKNSKQSIAIENNRWGLSMDAQVFRVLVLIYPFHSRPSLNRQLQPILRKIVNGTGNIIDICGRLGYAVAVENSIILQHFEDVAQTPKGDKN